MRKHTRLLGLTTAFCLISGSGGAEPKLKVDFGFDAYKVPAMKGNESPVARAFNEYIYLRDLGTSSASLDDAALRRLSGLLLQHLLRRFGEKEGITASDQEVDRFNHAMSLGLPKAENRNKDEPNATAARKDVGAAAVRRWKVDKKLYELYGGTVIFQQGNPQEPVGAYLGLLEDAEQSKVVEIFNKDNRDRFWAYFTRDQGPWKLPNDKIDFSKPWWEVIAAQQR